MTFSTPGPASDLQRCARYKAATPSDLPDPSSAGARGVAPESGASTDADILRLGMKLFLVSLMMIFGATFAAYVIIWWRNRADWEGAVDSREVAALAAATILLVVADVAAMRALKKATTLESARKLTAVTAVAAGLYLVVQSITWAPLLATADPMGGTLRMEGFLFLMLTFAHAAHVVGGIVANGIVLVRSSGGRGPSRGALQMLYQYWRFLTVVWVAVLALLLGL